jgi:pSer/pThr/pTyr-binding forkhead associated (FHA) protein
VAVLDFEQRSVGELKIKYEGQEYALSQRQTLIGRSRRCVIVLNSRLASREHCVLERSGSALTLIELGSKNGTWVNGERVSRRRQLAKGDEIRIGSDHLEVVEEARPSDPQPRRQVETQRMTRDTSDEPFEDDSTATVDHASVLDLAEVLLETASGPEQRPQTTRVILAAVDELLDHAGLTQPYLGPEEEKRLRAIADRVQSWWGDGSLSAWRQGLESRLAAAGRRR